MDLRVGERSVKTTRFYVYVLRSRKTGRRYVGSTQNVQTRIDRHNAGHHVATRGGRPWTLLHVETFLTRSEAVRRERYLKSGQGRAELDELLG